MTLSVEEAQQTTQRLFDELTRRRKETGRFDDYYRGKHPLHYASEHWRQFNSDRYKGFSDNWCGPVANAPSERLRLLGFRLPTGPRGASKATTKQEQLLWSVWDTQDMDVQSSQGILDAIVAKRSYVLVWGDSDDQPQDSWEDASQMIVAYDPERPRVRKAALKVWNDERNDYATLYTRDEVWKFQRPVYAVNVSNGQTDSGLYVPQTVGAVGGASGWQPRQPASDDTWPLANPLDEVPVVEYQNRPMLRAEPISEVEGVAAMQDAVNLLWAYLFAAADHASMPSRVILGQDLPTMPVLDDDGLIIGQKPVPLDKLEADRFLWLTKPETKIAEFTPSKLDVFTQVIEIAVGHIASQTRTPPHYLATNGKLINISGDALKAAETGLVKKVEEEQLFFGPSNREVMRLNALVLGDTKLAAAAARGTSLWADAEIRSDAQLTDTLVKLKTIGWPLRMLAERYGLSPGEVDRLMELRAEELATDPLNAALTPPVPDGAGGTDSGTDGNPTQD